MLPKQTCSLHDFMEKPVFKKLNIDFFKPIKQTQLKSQQLKNLNLVIVTKRGRTQI